MTWTPPPRSGVAGLDPTALRQQLARTGWSSLPIRRHDAGSKVAGKAPGIGEWQLFAAFEADAPTMTDIEAWRRREVDWPGTGIPCGSLVGIDLDFGSDAQLAGKARALGFEVFGETPFERQGAYPKILLVYRAAEAMPSLHLKAADGSGDGLDVLAEGTQFVAFGIHQTTLNPYAWIGAENPLTASPDAAPEITRAQVEEFIRRVGALVELSKTGGRKGRGGESATIVRDAEGYVIDGRECHLYRTVYSVARAMRAEGLDLDQDMLATRAWERFAETTRISDGHWGRVDAEIKARAIIAKWRSGRLDLDEDETDEERVEPTYPDRRRELSEAEAATRGVVADFFGSHVPAWREALALWKRAVEEAKEGKDVEAGAANPYDFDPEDKDEAPEGDLSKPIPTSWGMRIETATGKTREGRAGVVAAVRAGLTVVFAAPMHSLLDEIATAFRADGIEVRTYRGYTAADPDFPDTAMCLDLPAVRDAQEAAGRSVRETVCERKGEDGQKLLCAFHDRCGMTRQREAKAAVWLVPHALLFQAKPDYIPRPDAIVIDENVVMGALPNQPVRMTLDAIEAADCTVPSERNAFNIASGDLEQARANLCRALRDHPKEGPLRRAILLRHRVTAGEAGSAYQLEWQRLRDSGVVPGMKPKARKACVAIVGAHNRELKSLAGIWSELRAFLSGEAEASGRLHLRYDDKTGCRTLERRSLDVMRSSWSAPCLCMDATLPDPALIAPVLGHPVEMRADIAARWSPHGEVRQIVAAPVSATKLGIVEGRESELPRRAVTDLLRLIRLRAALAFPRVVVVIGLKRLIARLEGIGLPENVETGHFGAIAGIDKWNSAAGLIAIGQMQPGPRTAERDAGVLTGTVPNILPEPKPGAASKGVWFPWVEGGIRLADGTAAKVQHARHPDPVVEALRWQTTEAGLIQAIGRLRALRRGPDSPFFLDIVNDVPLPLTVDRIETWESAKPGAWAGMAPEGVLLECAGDIPACFPELAQTRQSAREVALPTVVVTSIERLSIGVTTTLRRATYKRLGRFRPASALLLPNAPDDLKSWLTDRLGAIEWLKVEDIEPAARPAEPPSPASAAEPQPARAPFPRAADYDPGLAAAYRCTVDRPADPTRPAPVRAEIVRFDPSAGIRFPAAVASCLTRIRAVEEAARRTTGARSGQRIPEPAEAMA